MKMLRNLLIIGNGGHGKNTVGELLEVHGHHALSSSAFATTRIMLPYFQSIGITYPSADACFADRINHRRPWFLEIERFNTPNAGRLAQEIRNHGYNVHIGIRSRREFDASRHLFDHVIWVDASERLPPESSSSMQLTRGDADIVVDNNGTQAQLADAVADLASHLRRWMLHTDTSSCRLFSGRYDALAASMAETPTIVFDWKSKTVQRQDKVAVMTPREMAILEYFLNNQDRVITKEEILAYLQTKAQPKIVDVFICKLRKNLDQLFGSDKNPIQTIWGRGWCFTLAAPSAIPKTPILTHVPLRLQRARWSYKLRRQIKAGIQNGTIDKDQIFTDNHITEDEYRTW